MEISMLPTMFRNYHPQKGKICQVMNLLSSIWLFRAIMNKTPYTHMENAVIR